MHWHIQTHVYIILKSAKEVIYMKTSEYKLNKL